MYVNKSFPLRLYKDVSQITCKTYSQLGSFQRSNRVNSYSYHWNPVFRFGIHGLGLGRYCLPTKMSDSLSQGIADKYCSLHIAHLALTSHCVVILSSLYDIERADGVTGKYTQVSSAIFSVASSCCPLILIRFIWTIKAMSWAGENNPKSSRGHGNR